MRKLKVAAAVLIATGFVAVGAAPAAASTEEAEAAYPVICFQEVLPGGQPLPEICLPWPV
jgi:hypothetical protein